MPYLGFSIDSSTNAVVRAPNHFAEELAPAKPDSRPPSNPERKEELPADVTAAGASQIVKTLFRVRMVTIFGEITDRLAREAVAQLLALNSLGRDPIRIFINTPGWARRIGRFDPRRAAVIGAPVQIIGTGWVASIGVLLYLGARRGSPYCLPNTRFMLHQPIGAFRGQATDALIHAAEVRKMRERLNHTIARETQQAIERVTKDSDRDYWLTAPRQRIMVSSITSFRM